MGLRGRLSAKVVHQARALTDLTPPTWLGKEAQLHYTKLAPMLVKNNLLTEQTADSYALMCQLWDTIRTQPTHKKWLDYVKSYNTLAKLFRLVPCDKPQGAPATRHDGFKELEEDG